MGRCRLPRPDSTIRAALGVQGEPEQPDDPAKGLVWSAIVRQINHPGSESQWVTITYMPRQRFARHPWSLSGGNSEELLNRLNSSVRLRLREYLADPVGFAAFSANDEAFNFPISWHSRFDTSSAFIRQLVAGKDIRSWAFESETYAIAPYDEAGGLMPLDVHKRWARHLWMVKSSMAESDDFSGGSRHESGVPWWSWYRWIARRNSGGARIIVAKIATHNEVTINRGRAITNQHVFSLRLRSEYEVDLSDAVLGVLNSSTACFWLKQVSQNKGAGGIGGGIGDEDWEPRYEFTGNKLEQFPLPGELPTEFGRELDRLAQRLSAVESLAVCSAGVPTRERLDAARVEHDHLRGRMIALQEELDWDVYRQYGLVDADEAGGLIAASASVPELKLGERAFEILLARRVVDGEVETQWFERHRSTPITEIPMHWPESYKAVVAKRTETIQSRRDIALIERPECKRRWQSEPWEMKERAALTSWLLDRCEDRGLWFAPDDWGRVQPRPMTISRLADRMRADGDVVSVARLLDGPDADLLGVLTRIIGDQHVPYLAQLRYTATGMRNRAQWEKTWGKQREEDDKGVRLDIDVPPKYKKEDFLKGSYWSQRGKLDVPKERFISYPLASPDGDDSLLLGWAGWDHREQAHALMGLIEDRSARDGWGGEKLTPLIAGLAEMMPWVRQWHAGTDPDSGISITEAYDAYLEDQRIRYGLSEENLRAWSPPTTGQRRGRRRKTVQPELPDQGEGV
jgi:hypothetical protein